MIHAVTLLDFARRFTESRALAEDYAATLRRRAAALAQFAGESAIALALTEAHVNAFLATLADRSPWTVKGYRGDLLTLWYAAADDGLVAYPVGRRIRRPRLPQLLIDCYSVEEARALLGCSHQLCGNYLNGVPKNLYWPAIILLAWDTGLRRGDLWSFRGNSVRPDGSLRIIQNKTQQIAHVQLRRATVAALDRIGLPRPLEWKFCRDQFGVHFQTIVKAAGVNRGSFKWLRRASGSYVEALQPGAGHKHLGHASAAIFTRHYDARLGAATLPMPPEL